MSIFIHKKRFYLSIPFLIDCNIPEATIRQWRVRKTGNWKIVNNTLSIAYESIPKCTKGRLPSEESLLKQYQAARYQQKLYDQLNAAKFLHWHKHRSAYQKDPSLSTEKVTHFAQLHSVFQAIIDLKEDGFRDLIPLHNVFNQLYPGKYSTKHALANAIRKALCDGIMSVALDKRVWGNNREANKDKETTTVKRFWITYLTAHASKFSCSKIHESIKIACEEKGFKTPSLSSVKNMRRECLRNIEVYKSRHGTNEAKRKMPYARLINAEKIHEQWQLERYIQTYHPSCNKTFY